MSGSGRRTEIINTQERVISPDINRLQLFNARDDAEMFRYMLDVTGNDDVDAGSVVTEPTVLESPLRAEIMNGLLVRPQPASLNLLVDPGVLYAIAPDGSADSSNYKYVHDVGVTVAGTLTIGAGGAGIRIDVIECRINPVDDIVSDNRDIFNPVTGLFTAQSVTKERAARLEYRVRAGVDGAGFPGTALGWLPLAVASVPIGAASVDVVTFWDVRPLINDRAYGGSALVNARPVYRPGTMVNAVTLATTTGLVDVVHNGRRIGGRLRSGGVVADADSIDVSAAANMAPGFAFAGNRTWYLYFMVPYGLPRWARYNAAGARVPRSPRGIPVVTNVAPDTAGNASAAFAPPLTTGLVVASSSAVAVAAGFTTPGAAQGGFYGDNANGFIMSSGSLTTQPLEFSFSAELLAGNNIDVDWVFTAGTEFPTHARGVLLDLGFGVVTNDFKIQGKAILGVFAPNGGALISQIPLSAFSDEEIAAGRIAANRIPIRNSVWVSLPPVYPSAAVYTIKIRYTFVNISSVALWAIAEETARVLGWKF